MGDAADRPGVPAGEVLVPGRPYRELRQLRPNRALQECPQLAKRTHARVAVAWTYLFAACADHSALIQAMHIAYLCKLAVTTTSGRGVFDGSEVSAGGVDYRPDHLSMLDIAVGAAER